ncbi:hypothetical protein [Chitinimonas sp.]|uniref:hypothetical protein n=1 Tax=Chitinimonas sp. TaxID=1934313 RepID=UPI002F91E32E
MFALLRFLFVLLVLLWGLCLWQEKRTGDRFWRRARGWLLRFTGVLLLIIVVGLFVERLTT